MDQRTPDHWALRSGALVVVLVLGCSHLVASWGTFVTVIDLLWLPPLAAMAALTIYDGVHKAHATEVRHS